MSQANGFSSAHNFDNLLRKQHQIIKKLEELKVKITDLKQAKKELMLLVKNFQEEIISGVVLLEDSDSDTS